MYENAVEGEASLLTPDNCVNGKETVSEKGYIVKRRIVLLHAIPPIYGCTLVELR